jgi:hypothetical protein
MAGPAIPVVPPLTGIPFVGPGGELTPAALNIIQQIWAAAFGLGGITPGLLLLGSLDQVNFNIAGDNQIVLALPSGAIGWRAALGLIFGTQGSFSAAHAGLYPLAFAQGTALIGQTALSGITATGFNTAGAVTPFTPGLTAIFNYSTLFLNVGTIQGGTSMGNFYLYGYPVF